MHHAPLLALPAAATSTDGRLHGVSSLNLGRLQRRPIFSGHPSERLDPGPQLDLPSPGAARLAVELEVGGGDGIGVEQAVRAAPLGARVARLTDGPVDDEMADMDVLRRELAGEALREAAQAEFAHGKRRRAGV